MSEPQQTSLIDQLRGVPIDARGIYDYSQFHSGSFPYGRMCNEAADEIYRLNAERDSLQQRLVALEDEKNAYIDYVGDALGQDDNESLWDAAQRVLSERDRLRSENEALRAMASDLISEINDHPETLEAHDLLAIISAALGEQR